jgi:histone acetyltransferase HTATIP
MLKFYKGSHTICLSDAVIEQHERSKKKRRRRIDPSKLKWRPPVFSRDQLRFGQCSFKYHLVSQSAYE